jgi:hypothetical protein
MPGVSIDDVGTTFTRFLPGVTETLNHTSKFRKLIRREDRWNGDHNEWRVHTSRNTGIGYVEDGGAFPVAGKQTYQTAKSYRRFLVGSVQVTDGTLATADGENAAIKVTTSELEGLTKNLMKMENFFMYKDGTGAVTTLVDATLASSASDVPVYDARGLWDGVNYENRDSAAITTLNGYSKVSKTAQATNSSFQPLVTFTATLTGAAADDYLVLPGSANRAVTGLDKLINDTATTFQAINVSTYPRYSSFVVDNSGTKRDLTPTMFRQLLAGIIQKTGDEPPQNGLTVLTSAWQMINVEELYEGQLRLTPTDTVGGFVVSSFQSALGKINITVDTDAPYSTIYACDLNEIVRSVQRELDWRRQGGSIFLRSDAAGVWTATAMEIGEMYIKNRSSSGRIDDLNCNVLGAY